MTLEEAKKILKKEGFYVEKATRPCAISESFIEYEDPTICEAMQVVNSAGYGISMESSRFDERKARLKKEFEEHANVPVSGKEQPKEKKGIIYPSTSPKADFYYKHVLNEGNPALKKAASQFNDALLDEQAKTIAKQNKELTRLISLVEKKENSISRLYYEKSVLEKENEDLKKGEIPARYFDKALVDEQAEKIKKLEHEKLDILEIASSSKQTIAEQRKKIKRLGKIIHKKNLKIEELRKESSRHLRGKIKIFGENLDLSQELCDKNEELRLTKIREKNLTEVCQKYVKENEELKKKLADKIVDEIDARALKSAESALAYKEKVIAEKDEVIADLGKELAATKKELEGTNNLVRMVRNASKEYCEYGIAAEKMIQKLSKIIVSKGLVPSDVFEKCRLWANGYRFNPQLYDFIEEEEKRLEHAKKIRVSSDNAEEGADLYGVIVLRDKDYIDALKKAKDADIWQE